MLRPCKSGGLFRLAAVSLLGICTGFARIAARVNSLQRSGIYQINDLVKTVKEWQHAPLSKYASSPHPGAPARGDVDGRMQARRGKTPPGTFYLVGRSDAACGGQSAEGERQLGFVISFISPTLIGPFPIILWASKFTGKLVNRSLGGGVLAFSEMLDHMSLPRNF